MYTQARGSHLGTTRDKHWDKMLRPKGGNDDNVLVSWWPCGASTATGHWPLQPAPRRSEPLFAGLGFADEQDPELTFPF